MKKRGALWMVLFGVLAVAVAGRVGAADESTASVPPALSGPAADLFARMVALNADLRSYKADLHAQVALKTFPYINPTIDGSLYFKSPNREAAIFDTLPALASQFKKVYPRVPLPSQWPSVYTIALRGDANGATSFRLVPIKNGRVEHLDVTVSDATATITSYTWTYKDGGYITFQQSYKAIGNDYLIDKQTGHVELPSYKADVTNTLSNYKLNVPISDEVFSGS